MQAKFGDAAAASASLRLQQPRTVGQRRGEGAGDAVGRWLAHGEDDRGGGRTRKHGHPVRARPGPQLGMHTQAHAQTLAASHSRRNNAAYTPTGNGLYTRRRGRGGRDSGSVASSVSDAVESLHPAASSYAQLHGSPSSASYTTRHFPARGRRGGVNKQAGGGSVPASRRVTKVSGSGRTRVRAHTPQRLRVGSLDAEAQRDGGAVGNGHVHAAVGALASPPQSPEPESWHGEVASYADSHDEYAFERARVRQHGWVGPRL